MTTLAAHDVQALIDGAREREERATGMLRDGKLAGVREMICDAANAWERAGRLEEATLVRSGASIDADVPTTREAMFVAADAAEERRWDIVPCLLARQEQK